MARIIIFLLYLLLKSNAYAYCYASSWTSYGPVFSSLYVNGDTSLAACQQLACQIYTHIPECSYYLQPTCQNQTEYQSLSCQPHYSGAINQSRTYQCSNQSWSAWTTTSNNCTPDTPTCIEATETRQLTCQAGYEGLLQEQRTSLCSDPYGSPTWTAWSELLNTCTMTATNINNPTSPISPISPTNPNSVISQQVTSVPIIQPEPVIVQDMTALTTTVTETPATSVATVKNETSGVTSVPSPVSTTTTSGTVKAPEAPKGKEIVPGFGIVMSMQLLNQGYTMQQQQIQEAISLEQENEYGRTQEFTLSLLAETAVGDRFDTLNRNRWASLLRNYPLQRLELYDRRSQEDE
jgi:hypothetical protein